MKQEENYKKINRNDIFILKLLKMQKQYKLKNIVINLINTLKKQDFLVYFRKISILEISDKEIVF